MFGGMRNSQASAAVDPKNILIKLEGRWRGGGLEQRGRWEAGTACWEFMFQRGVAATYSSAHGAYTPCCNKGVCVHVWVCMLMHVHARTLRATSFAFLFWVEEKAWKRQLVRKILSLQVSTPGQQLLLSPCWNDFLVLLGAVDNFPDLQRRGRLCLSLISRYLCSSTGEVVLAPCSSPSPASGV